MKKVILYTIKEQDIFVEDLVKGYLTLTLDNRLNIIQNSTEYVTFPYVKETILPIKKIVDNGTEEYIAVDSKVWEYLYLLENPVDAKTQKEKIDRLEYKVHHLNVKLHQEKYQHNYINGLLDTILEAKVFKRIKWLFTGIKPY